MAKNFKSSMKKRAIVLSAIAVALVSVAVVGTVSFFKDRGTTEATDIATEQISNENINDGENNSTENQTDTQSDDGSNQGTANEGGEATPNGSTTVTASTGTGTRRPSTGTQQSTDTIRETVITRTEVEEIPERQISEGHYVGWTPINLVADIASSRITAKYDNLSINKIAETKTGENLVTRGEEITYKISVKNNTEKQIKGIEIKDIIPGMTVYKENSVDNSGKVISNESEVLGIKWNIDLKAGEEKTVSFQVVVSDYAEGIIKNLAVVNGEKTNEVKTAVVTLDKKASINGEENIPAKLGDKVTYSIIVTNTGNIDGKANVKDVTLEKLISEGILKIEKNSEEIAQKLIKGTVIEVPANDEGKISFVATVQKINGAIKNVATVGNEKADRTVETINIVGEKTSTHKENLTEDDEINYTISIKNTGSATGKITVTDKIPEGTKYVENSINNNGIYNREIDTLEWKNIELASGEEKELSFKVIILPFSNGEERKEIINKASIGNEVKAIVTKKLINKEINKTWVNDVENLREAIEVELLANGKEVEGKVAKLNTENNWNNIFENLPKYDENGIEVNYSVKELTQIEGYKSKVEGMTITNTYEEPTTSKTAIKVWKKDAEGLRPEEITVQLLANGEEVEGKTARLNKENNWTAEFTELQKYETLTRNEIEYSVKEVEVPEGYTSRIDEENSMQIINTYEEPTTSKTATKVWEKDAEGLRPEEITVQLLEQEKRLDLWG